MIDLLYVPPVSIALFRGHAKREPSAGLFRSKSASFRQFQWRGESLGEARSAVGFVGNSPPCPRQRTRPKIGIADTKKGGRYRSPFPRQARKPFPIPLLPRLPT